MDLMGPAEISDLLGVSRQRVHQLQSTAAFPKPLAHLRCGAIWDAADIEQFARDWPRTPGRPRKEQS